MVNLTVAFDGDGKGSVPLDETNLIWECALHVLEAEAKTKHHLQPYTKERSFIQHIHLDIHNDVNIFYLFIYFNYYLI